MDYQNVAAQVLDNVGGPSNISRVATCLTRLRLDLHNLNLAHLDALRNLSGVLGVVTKGDSGLEVVFGPSSIEPIAEAFQDASSIAIDNLGNSSTQEPSHSVVDDFDLEKGFEFQAEHDEPTTQQNNDYAITAGKLKSYRAQQHAAIKAGKLVKEDIEALQSFLAENGDMPARNTTVNTGKSVLVINGPNLNMLGLREPNIYGQQNYAALVSLCKKAAAEAGFTECKCYQSNHEGALVDEIQNALGVFDGIVINPGAYTHTSVAILDAVKAVQLPCVEVHISKVEDREDFRQVSYIRAACFETITGLGLEGYRKAILDLARKLNS